MTGTAGGPLAEQPRDSVDMIIPWSKVRTGDLVLLDETLTPVALTEAADGLVTVKCGDAWMSPRDASRLTAVRRPVTCALCGAVLARVTGGPWVRLDEPRRGDPFCGADQGDEPQPHEPTVLDVADYSRLRLALADLEEADARRCYH